jgi:hypothetical protein
MGRPSLIGKVDARLYSPTLLQMRAAVSLAILFATTAAAFAGAIQITSPNHARTWAYGETTWRQLYLDKASGTLTARITFSNLPYADFNDPPRDEPFDFRFPGVRFDPAHRTFFARGRRGEIIPVARFRSGLASGWIDLAAGAKMYLLKESGRVTAVLTATDYPRRGSQWIEMDNNWSLQNMLCTLFGGPAPGSPLVVE